MMSLHRLSAGAGYQYLLRHTACGDVRRASSTPLTAYYTDSGYPPGRWIGRGLAGVEVPLGSAVTEVQMARLFGEGCDPLSGQALGRSYPKFRALADRIAVLVDALPADLNATERADHIVKIRTRESARPSPCAVAGFDLTFTVPKSASVLWALADPTVQEAVADAHRAALNEAMALFEERALFTRTGAAGCAQVPTRGMLATAFDHWDTRTGDPNLHTHVVVANKVQGTDGKWRSLDSRALHHAAVAVSELYDTVFADELALRLPVSWSWRDRGERRSPAFELDGVSDDLLSCFSTRSVQVDEAMTGMLRQFQSEHGRSPNRVEVLQLRQRATRATRPTKALQPLPQLMDKWRSQAQDRTGNDVRVTAQAALGHEAARITRDDVSPDLLDDLTQKTLDAVLQRRSTWTPWNVMTEACRTTRALRMTSVDERKRLLDDVTSEVLTRSVGLDPESVLRLPVEYLREDGTSVFDRAGETKFSHPSILQAERRLLAANASGGGPTVNEQVARRLATTPQRGATETVHLAEDQVASILAIATSGRPIDVLVGPAGAGKTTTLRALRAAWETERGRGSVLGLAPSSTAAHELSEALSIPCENTAKWTYETRGPGGQRRRAELSSPPLSEDRTLSARRTSLLSEQRRWELHPNQLVIVDEASLAGTLALDELREQAKLAGAKLLLVGDHRQLSSVDAGGAFGLLAERGSANELRSLWRFRHRWEAAATRLLRRGDHDALEAYADRDRLRPGTAEVVLEDAYLGWQDSDRRGESTILVAADGHSVEALNHRAHEDRVAVGLVQTGGVALGPDGERGRAAVGDRVLTRRNNRSLAVAGRGHVRNGALWTVVSTGADGSLLVTPADRHATHDCHPDPSVQVLLPAAYVAEHVDLGYATTAHRAQGLTVDECHVLVSGAMSREALYVAMTRGRSSNIAYVATDAVDPDCEQIPDVHAVRTARQVLEQVLNRSGAELSATQTREQLLREATSLTVLQPIRDTLLSDADTLAWQPRVQCLLSPEHAASVESSPARGALYAALRRGQSQGLPMAATLPGLIQDRSLMGADDVAAVLHDRVELWVSRQMVPQAESECAPLTGIGEAIAQLDDLIAERLNQAAVSSPGSVYDEADWRSLMEREPTMMDR